MTENFSGDHCADECGGKRVGVNGTSLWLAAEGNGPPMVLIHGGPGASSDYLLPVSAMLADVARVYRYDQRGCGRSDRAGPYDVLTAVDDLEAIREHLQHETWTLLGHSYGALLSLAYAVKYPQRVRGLIYACGTGIDNTWKAEYRRNRDRSPAEPLPDFGFPGNEEVNRVGNAAIETFLAAADLEHRLPRILTPGVVIHGEADLRPQWAAERVAWLLPNARFLAIANAPHYIWLTHAAEFREAIRSFWDGVHGGDRDQ
jgi:proline iminopeptidase